MDEPDKSAPVTAAAEEFPPFDPPELSEPDVPVAEAVADAPQTKTGELKEDPWAETPAPAAPPPPPKLGGLFVLGIIIVAASAASVFLWVQNSHLQTKVDQLVSEAAQRADLSAQPGGAKSDVPLIVSAVYGSGTHFVDVTSRVNELLAQPDHEFHARPDFLKKDPTPGWNKQLVIIYEFHGQRQMLSTGEGGTVKLAALREAK
jgi:hypothetical protein